MTYHLADIYTDELNKASANPPVPSPLPTPLTILLNPFFGVAAHTPNKTTYQRIQTALIDPLLDALATPAQDNDGEPPARKRQKMAETYEDLLVNACSVDPRKEGILSRVALRKKLLQRIFDVASQGATRDANRRKMYAIWKSNTDDDDDEEEDRPPDAKTVFS